MKLERKTKKSSDVLVGQIKVYMKKKVQGFFKILPVEFICILSFDFKSLRSSLARSVCSDIGSIRKEESLSPLLIFKSHGLKNTFQKALLVFPGDFCL